MNTLTTPSDSQIAPDEDELQSPNAAEFPNKARSVKSTPDLSVVIKGKDGNFRPWSETANATSLSSNGGGFFLSRECPVGCLVSLIMAMPLHLRKYDQDKRLYRTWGLVQYCYEAGGEEKPGFHVGVALIGRDAPQSYVQNPLQSYRVAGMARDGLWKIDELETSFRQRASVRYWNSIEASLYQLDGELHSIASEKIVTENISESGASVFSDLSLPVGDRIKFQTSSPPFSSLAVIRSRRIGVDNRTRLHLEFVENTFPVLAIEAPIEEEGEH
jgi:hypothetical protein